MRGVLEATRPHHRDLRVREHSGVCGQAVEPILERLTMKKKDPYRTKAEKIWRRAEWIEGSGRFALLAHCKVLTVSLWNDFDKCCKQKAFIDRYGCGGLCCKNHEIIDMGKVL